MRNGRFDIRKIRVGCSGLEVEYSYRPNHAGSCGISVDEPRANLTPVHACLTKLKSLRQRERDAWRLWCLWCCGIWSPRSSRAPGSRSTVAPPTLAPHSDTHMPTSLATRGGQRTHALTLHQAGASLVPPLPYLCDRQCVTYMFIDGVSVLCWRFIIAFQQLIAVDYIQSCVSFKIKQISVQLGFIYLPYRDICIYYPQILQKAIYYSPATYLPSYYNFNCNCLLFKSILDAVIKSMIIFG